MAQIGIMLEGQAGLNWERWAAILQMAEEVGYQCVFRSDHFNVGAFDDSLEMWISLTYAAMNTKRIEFGPLVTPITFRHPSMNVRYALQIDDLSGGRLVFGIGAGWNEDEHNRWGVPFYDFPTRFDMLEDALEISTLLLNSDGEVTYEGKHFSLKGAHILPRPSRAGGPPILIGGGGPKRTLPLVARYANEWNVSSLPFETYQEKRDLLNEYLEAQGRKPGDVKRSLLTDVAYGRTDAEVKARVEKLGIPVDEWHARNKIIGTTQEVIDRLGRWVELGVQRFMLRTNDHSDIEVMANLAADILPHFHKD